MIQRYRQVFAGLAQIQAHDAVSARNNNAASDFRQGLLNTFQAVQTGQKISTMSQIRASDANTTFPVPVDECFNVTSISFCQQCFAINLFLGFNARTGQAGLYYYNISIPPPQPACTFATANANFEFFSLYLFNMTSASPLTIGNSDSLPARFPARGHSPWAYLDDHVPSKNYFSAYDSLFNATWTFILNAIHSIDVFSSDPFNLASVNATNVTVVGAAARKEHVRTEAWKKGVPKPLPLGELPFTDRFLESMAAWMPAVHITATNFTTFQQIIEGYINLVITEFVICQYGSDLDGTNTHMSLLQALVILIIIIAILALIWSVLSSVFQAVWTFLLSFLVDAGQAIFMGTALRIVSQGLLSLFVLFFFISLATGWRLLCFPLVPPILFSSQVMSLATTVFPKCPVLYAGLINEQDYANGVCMLCNLWQEGHWSVASCKSDLNWNPLDVPVAFLRWYFPDALAFIQTPANFAFPFSALIAASGVQAYLHKYDSVDIQGDDIIYSQQLSCLFLVELIPFLVYSELLGFLILSSPTFAILRFLLAIASVAISALFAFIISFFVGMYFTLLLPLRVVRYQRLDSQRRTKL
jgi:hypothetical protein